MRTITVAIAAKMIILVVVVSDVSEGIVASE